MGWNELIQKTAYWLHLRQLRKHPADVEPEPSAGGAGLPEKVVWQKVCEFEREAYKVSALMPIRGGVILCCYNNRERGTSRVFRCGNDGSKTEIWKGGEETIGQGSEMGGCWFLPVEKKGGDVLAVTSDGTSCKPYVSQGGQYACRIVEWHIAVGNQLFAIANTGAPVATFPRLAGIVCGLVHVGDEWIASDDQCGIQSSRGWFVECKCSELAVVGGRVLAFLRSGEVRVVQGEGLCRTIGNTLHKCRRAWSNGTCCWWTVAPSDGGARHDVWCTDGRAMRNLGGVEGKRENTPAGELGSLFGSAICEADDGTIWLAVSNRTEDGWELYRGTATYPAPEPTPEPTPAPTPAPAPAEIPARTGKPSYTGKGVWNTYLEIANAPTPKTSLRIRAWFRAKSWSGGGKEQPEGFCLVNRGLVGSHWGYNITIRPNGIVVNGTKGECEAPCKVSLGEWHYIDCTIAKRGATASLDGKAVTFPTTGVDLLASSSEPLRIGGYRCPWEGATFYNQSINGDVTDWILEAK